MKKAEIKMGEVDDQLPGWPFRRSLAEIMAIMTEHGMTQPEAMHAIAHPDLIPERVRLILRQVPKLQK